MIEASDFHIVTGDTTAQPLLLCAALLCVPSMGTVLMGLKSPVDKPDMTKTYS